VSSCEHWNVTDASLAVNSNRAERDVELGGGVAVKLTPGASVSGGGGGGVVPGGGVVCVAGGVGAVNVTVAAVVAPGGGGGVRFGFGFGSAGGRRGCVVTAELCVPGEAATVGWVSVGAASVVAVSLEVVCPCDGATGGFGFVTTLAVPGRAGESTEVLGVVVASVDVGFEAETVTGAGVAPRVVRPRSVAVPTPLATRSAAAPVATTTAVAPRGRASRAPRPLGRQ
jgi:hypothetical protein